MALSPNYGWSEPDNSSLVKNGAADIRTLGDAIDTSLWNVGYGQAGKNKIINGDFGIWQRGTSFSTFGMTADRWNYGWGGGTGITGTITRQTFTPSTAPVSGYEGTFFLRHNITNTGGATSVEIESKLEDVRLFAGQTVTLSAWLKADAARTFKFEIVQDFGSGGSTAVRTSGSTQTLTTGWVRYTQTISVPSISGKTIGTGSNLRARLTIDPANYTVDIWGAQLEAGSTATPFQTATGNPASELAACQRYYFRNTGGQTYSHYGVGMSISTSYGYALIHLPVTMRTNPTSVDYANVGITDDVNYQLAASSLIINWASPSAVQVSVNTAASQVQYRTAYLTNQNNTAGYIGFSAEL